MDADKKAKAEAAGWKFGSAEEFMSIFPIKDAPMLAMKNRDSLNGKCGCFSCLAIFDAEKIIEWTDQSRTALCPECGADAVLPESNPETLSATKQYWLK